MFELTEASGERPAALATQPSRAGMPVDPGRLWTALSRSRRALVGTAVAGLVIGGVLAKTAIPREFTSASTIVREPGTPLSGDARSDPRADPRELRALVDSMTLSGNIFEARRRLALPVAIDALAGRVVVTSNERSNLVTVAATWSDAETPPRIANTVVDVFLARRVEAQRERLQTLLATASNDAAKAKGELTEARRAFDAFRDQNGVADLTAETQVAIEQAAKLRADAGSAKADAAGEEARANALQKAAGRESPTSVISWTEMHPQAVKLAETTAELAGARAALSSEHPKVQALAAAAEGLRSGASTERSGVVGDRVIGRNPQLDAMMQIWAESMAAREGAVRREAALADLTRAADLRVTKLRSLEGPATELSSGVRRAQERVDELEKLVSKATLALRSPESGFRVVDPAVRPEAPSKSSRRLFAIAAPFGALAMAAIYLLTKALWGLYVHTARELAFWGGGPVIASSRFPADARARQDLIVDLWAHAGSTDGVTLVVPMSPVERTDAALVAAALNPPDLAVDRPHVVDRPQAAVPPQAANAPQGSPAEGARPALSSGATLWTGAATGPEIRRAARLADRVLVVVEAGVHTAAAIASVPDRVGRTRGVGYVLLGVGSALSALPDRAGDVGGFWALGHSDALQSPREVSDA